MPDSRRINIALNGPEDGGKFVYQTARQRSGPLGSALDSTSKIEEKQVAGPCPVGTTLAGVTREEVNKVPVCFGAAAFLHMQRAFSTYSKKKK